MHGSSTKMLFQPLKQCKVGSILSSEKVVILKNWCTLPNLAKLSATKNQQKILPILPKRERFLREIKRGYDGWTVSSFTQKAVVDKTFIRELPNICKLNVGVDASQLNPFSISQDMSTGLGGATSFDSFLKAVKASDTKGFSLTSDLTVQTSSRIKNYLHTKPFSVSLQTIKTLIRILRTIRT